MHKFQCNNNLDWGVVISVGSIKKCRKLLGIDLQAALSDGLSGLATILSDPVTLADVLFVLVKEQADARGISDEQFGSALAGDCIITARNCFLDALIDYTPSQQVRDGLRRAIKAAHRLEKSNLDALENSFEKALKNLEENTKPIATA